ncbi:hypothetical protein U4I37_20060 [Stenotrophomonas maltophilia]|uniref:hypothetical protein n=1 Tax=Stenotrophomonas maltophilia TaxID=40324 RepID=UPI002ACCE457|nr:hypothetical protein [Stenotrophomonas maltophilia]MDZ5788537.1 hypothetical protein [Stenotrophomonas maltophilia]
MSNHIELIAELRSASKTMSVKGVGNTVTHMLAAQLIARAADALATSYTPAQMAESFRSGLATARMHDHDVNPSAPDWRNAPPEAQFCAMDSDGQWGWYTSRPYTDSFAGYEGWDADTGVTEIRGLAFYPNWKDTLQGRPGNLHSSDEGPLGEEQLLVLAAQAQRNAVGDSSVIAARIDQMVEEVRGAEGTSSA